MICTFTLSGGSLPDGVVLDARTGRIMTDRGWGAVAHDGIKFARARIQERYRFPFLIDTLYCDARTVAETYTEMQPFHTLLSNLYGTPTNWYQNEPHEWAGKELTEDWTLDGHGLYVFRLEEHRQHLIDHGVFVPQDTIKPWVRPSGMSPAHGDFENHGPEITAWCRENTRGFCRASNFFLFEHPDDAFSFKMRWY